MARWCGKCSSDLPEGAFYEGQRWCIKCLKAASRAAQIKRRERAKAFVAAFLRAHPCVDCGETDPVVLEFDHVRGKFRGISAMAHDALPCDEIAAEIALCDVVCVNCHRRRTAARREPSRPYAARRARRVRNVAYVRSVLAEHGCTDCGAGDVEVLEFDHRRDKRASVADLAWFEYSLARIRAEIAKCEVRCGNCHRRRTAHELGHYRPVAS